MQSYPTVDAYLSDNPNSNATLHELCQIVRTTEMVEEVKWGAPIYTVNGKNVVGLAAYNNYVGLWFHQGVFLSDHAKVLINAQEGVTKGLRQWRFAPGDTVDRTLVLQYLEEAIANQKAGKEIKVEKKPLIIPSELQAAMDSDPVLRNGFEQFTPGKQREFANYVAEAKREETRLKRTEKVRPMIIEGIGLNDRYR